ncbi:MAG TPA: hypothetical protein VKF37_13050 [Chloroflexota bacterium]|nr:hypothetical protein [Chloroflexota bacterium]
MSPEEQGGPDRPPPAHEGRITIEGEQIRPYHSHLVLNFVVKQDGASVYPGRVKLTDPQDRQRVAHEVVAAIAPRANGQCPNAQEVLERFLAIRDEMEESGGGGAAFSARDQLIGLVLQHAELFHDAAKTCYARVTVADHEETYPTESGDVRLWMESLYYQQTGKGLGAQTITDAVSQINAEARFKGPEREVWRRVAPTGRAAATSTCATEAATPCTWCRGAGAWCRTRPQSSSAAPGPRRCRCPPWAATSTASRATSTCTTPSPGRWSRPTWWPGSTPPAPTPCCSSAPSTARPRRPRGA